MMSELDPAATAMTPTSANLAPPEGQTSSSLQPARAREGAGFRADVVGALVCAGVGLILAIAPHLTMLARHGTLAFLADGDDVLYLAISRLPYHGEPGLRDPFCGPWEV